MEQVDEVKSKVDIVEIIREHVELKRAGRNYKGLCPFHSEKTPSFMVSPELQIFKCFGCGEGGDVISFLQKYEGMEFYEALKYLAERVGVSLKPISGVQRGEKEIFFEINDEASRFYHYILLKHELGKIYLDYLLNERGLKEDTIKEFRIGAAPDRPNLLLNYFTKKRKYAERDLVSCGLVVSTPRGSFDRFRGRIIFPIRDHRGRTIGFSGRIHPSFAEKGYAKYINSPESLVYSKSNSLYGLDSAKGYIKRSGVVVIVEGPLDVVSSWQAGVRNVVAIQGTALTYEHTRILSRFANSVVLALDSDFAGNNAAIRSISQAQEMGVDVRVAKLLKYKDPDEFARNDPSGYRKFLKKSINIWDFLIGVIFSRYKSLDEGSAKLKISREIIPVISSIPDKIVQAHYIKKVSKKLGVDESAVVSQVNEFSKDQFFHDAFFKEGLEKKQVARDLWEERLMSLFVKYKPDVFAREEYKDLFSSRLLKKLYEKIESYMKAGKKFKPGDFLNELEDEYKEGFSRLFLADEDLEIQNLEKEIKKLIQRIKLEDVKEEIEKLKKVLAELEEKGKNDKLDEVNQRLSTLLKERAELEADYV